MSSPTRRSPGTRSRCSPTRAGSLPRGADGHARTRIFTPQIELPFAGHPTLGTAFVLAQPMQLEVIRLETLAGTVPVALARGGGQVIFGRMEQPGPSRE